MLGRYPIVLHGGRQDYWKVIRAASEKVLAPEKMGPELEGSSPCQHWNSRDSPAGNTVE